ncbi:hypothetical protein ACHWQZ_G008177 [Mnemiopsis leidyi]
MSRKKSSSRQSLGAVRNTPSAYFDEICQISSILNCGLEQEWIEFISNQADLQQRCHAAEGEVTRLRMQVNQYKSDKEASDLRVKHIRKQLAEEKSQKQSLSKQNEKLIQQIRVIKEILEDRDRMSMMTDEDKTALGLNRSHLRKQFDKVFEDVSVDLDSDQSLEPSFEGAEELEETKTEWRRRSRRSNVRKSDRISTGQVAMKKRRTSNLHAPKEEVYMTMEPTTSESSEPPVIYPNLKKFNKANPVPVVAAEVISMSDATTISTTETESDAEYVQSDTESISSTTSESSLPNRAHHFALKSMIKPEGCKACRKRLGFSAHALRCKYCKMVVHVECKNAAPMPCVPVLSTSSKKQDGTLGSYVPKNPPHVPSILLRCVQEIEARGLNETGLYRVTGPDKAIKELKERMLRPRCQTNLRKVEDTTILTGVVKNFLMNLNDPILTSALSDEFKEYAEKGSTNHLYGTISKLPHENRHTLAFMIIHLQKVSESEHCKMPRSNIARVFAPTLVASIAMTDMDSAMRDTKRSAKVVECLLDLPPSYWHNMLNPHDECSSPTPYSHDEAPHTPGTPEMLKVQPGMYQPPTPTNSKETTFTQRVFGGKKKTFFNKFETP